MDVRKKNFDEIKKEHGLNRMQQKVLEHFWKNSTEKYSVEDVIKIFRKRYNDNSISRNRIAPRITELVQKGLINVVGTDQYQHFDPLSERTKKIHFNIFQYNNYEDQLRLF